MPKPNSRATLSLVTAVLLGCSPSPRQTPENLPQPPSSAQLTPTPAVTATGTTPPSPTASKGEIPPAIRELRAKLEPSGEVKAPATSAPIPTAPPTEVAAPIPDAEKLTQSAARVISELSQALEQGDFKQAEALCIQQSDLGKVLGASYVPIIGSGVPTQNAAAIQHLIAGLKGKKWSSDFQPGRLSRAPGRSAFLGGLILMSGSIVRFRSEGVTIEAHLEELTHFGEDWRIFRLRAP